MKSPYCHLMCVYIKGHSGFILCLHSLVISHVETVDTKENRYIKAYNAFYAMDVDTVQTGVCSFYATLYSVQWPLAPPRGKATEKPPILWVQQFTSPRRQLCNFLGLIKLQGQLQARCTAIPQLLKLPHLPHKCGKEHEGWLQPPWLWSKQFLN